MKIIILFSLSLGILSSCLFSNCKKVPLRQDELEWFSSFQKGDTLIYKSLNDADTFICDDVGIDYTTCSKFELGDYIYQYASVTIYNTNGIYKMGMSFSKSLQKDTNTLCYKRFCVYDFKNESENEEFPYVEVILRNGNKYDCVFLVGHAYSYDVRKVYWSKTHGLVKYVKRNGDEYELQE